MTVIYFVRHGQTDWNRLGVFRGRADRPLDERGLRQVERVKDALKDKGVESLFAGPLKRTIQTFLPLAGSGKINVIDDLVDIDYGEWQGEKKEDVKKKWPDLWDRWHSDPFSVAFPGGESLVKVQERAVAAVNQIRESVGNAAVAVCTHRVVLKALFCSFVRAEAKTAFYTFKLDPASISIVRYMDDLPVIAGFNDTRHLEGENLSIGIQDF